MTTLTVAIDALLDVARADFLTNAADPTYGTLYSNMLWHANTPWNQGIKHTYPTVFLYDNAGIATSQGLGTAKTWRYPRVRVEGFANTYADVMAMMEQLRTAWITDHDYVAGDGSAGQGYLQQIGGIKVLQIGEHVAVEWDKRGLIFRRFMDVTIEIGDE